MENRESWLHYSSVVALLIPFGFFLLWVSVAADASIPAIQKSSYFLSYFPEFMRDETGLAVSALSAAFLSMGLSFQAVLKRSSSWGLWRNIPVLFLSSMLALWLLFTLL